MSSHREAPSISTDPVADNTDVYAFVDTPTTVTLIANYIPLEPPDSGPNFFKFGDDVLYEIHIDNVGDGNAHISYQFQFTTQITNPMTFLYNTGPIGSLTDPNWNIRQVYSVTKVVNGVSTVLGTNLPTPPCNIGPRSTPNYVANLVTPAIKTLPTGETVFAGQRREGFYVDLGSVFDLLDLRPFQQLQVFSTAPNNVAAPGVDATALVNVHSIAIQVKMTDLTVGGYNPVTGGGGVTDHRATVGVWATASRRRALIRGSQQLQTGPWVQVSRLGNPLINEAVIPVSKKDYWNSVQPKYDSQFNEYYRNPEVSQLLPVLYPTAFPNLAALDTQVKANTKSRADVIAILLTGLPAGLVGGFQNQIGAAPVKADMLRLNMAVLMTGSPNKYGIPGGDLAGFPNGRRPIDDVFTIELRVLAGQLYGLVDTYTPDAAASAVTDLQNPPADPANRFIATFPYLGTPLDGFSTPNAPTA